MIKFKPIENVIRLLVHEMLVSYSVPGTQCAQEVRLQVTLSSAVELISWRPVIDCPKL